QPAGERRQRPLDDPFREDVSERQFAVLQELPPQEVDLSAEGSSVRIVHRGPPWRGWGGCNLHRPKRDPLCPCRFRLSACGDPRAIRASDRSTQQPLKTEVISP